MKLNLEIPTHITGIELYILKDSSKLALTAKPGGNHVRVEKLLTTTKIAFDHTYIQYVVNELAEALK